MARLIDAKAVAALLNVSLSTIERQHAAGKLPTPRRIGRTIRWDVQELNEWVSRPLPNGRLMSRAEWTPVWAAIVKAHHTWSS